MSETEKRNTEKPKPFVFLVIRGRKRFKPSEIAIAEKVATTKDSLWFEMEAWLSEHKRIGA